MSFKFNPLWLLCPCPLGIMILKHFNAHKTFRTLMNFCGRMHWKWSRQSRQSNALLWNITVKQTPRTLQLMMIGIWTWYQMKIHFKGLLTVLTRTCYQLLWWRKSVKILQNHVCNVLLKTIKTLKSLAKFNHRFHFFSSPFQLVR